MIKFLVVDDEKGTCVQLKEFLENRGYKAFSANDGKSALDVTKKEEPNIVILDIRMPGLNGIEVLREIKKLNAKTRVIMLTGYEDETTRSISKELGASAYMTKPYNFEEILQVARKLINEIYDEEAKKK
ncbi:response regulator [Candidatus Omnitrophota bacterium]